MYSLEYLEKAHEASSDHRKILLESEQCACFYCLKIYDSGEIIQWLDNGNTAICPYCDVDAVLPGNAGFPITDSDFLTRMNEYWF